MKVVHVYTIVAEQPDFTAFEKFFKVKNSKAKAIIKVEIAITNTMTMISIPVGRLLKAGTDNRPTIEPIIAPRLPFLLY